MKKKTINDEDKKIPQLSKFWKIMKVTCLLIMLALVQVSASTYSQSIKLKINLKNVTLSEVFHEIERRSDFRFFYDNNELDLSKRMNLNTENSNIEEILEDLFQDSDISYEIIDHYIIIRNKRTNSGFARSAVQQKGKTVTGKIVDINNQPLPGVTVLVKGSMRGTISDPNGKFSITNLTPDVILVFSFVGMKTQEVEVSEKSVIDVVLTDESIGLEEVVAIGYGSVKRKDLTGSVSSVSGNALKDIPVTSAAQAIVGKMPGVQVTQTEGSPDAEIKIRVRGGGSITQDNSPLYIVDGFPVSNLSDIAPTDIESINVLKDASSTAIYGARGANGVIMITTKGGSEGKSKVSYNTYYGIKNITNYFDVLDPYEYVFWQYELQNANTSFEKYFGDFQDMKLYKQMDGTNWQKEIFGRTGTSLYNNLTFTGGNKDIKYNLSLTRNDEKEIMLGSGYERTNFTAKTIYKVNDWLSLDMNLRLSDYKLKGAGTYSNTRMAHIVQFRPINGLADFVDSQLTDDDFETASTFILNPLKQTNDDYRRRNTETFNYNGAATIKLTKDLNYRFDLGVQYTKGTINQFYGINTSNAMNYGTQPLAEKTKSDGVSYRIANVLTYNKKDFFKGNNISVMLGEELNSSRTQTLRASVKYLPKYIDPVSALSMMNLGIADPVYTDAGTPVKLSSFFGRINYDYEGRYLASFTFRADGSSKFAKGNQWGYFPSAGLGWRLSDENFLKGTENWLSDLKLRASYGESGNNRISDDLWRKTFSVSTGRLFIEGSENSPTAYLTPVSTLSNPNLKWETTITRNFGVDFSLFNQRLSGSVEIYKNTTKDLLISATIPASSGYSNQMQNIGQTSNKGIEIVLNGAVIQKRDFKLSFSFNIAFNKNRIDKLGETKSWEQSSGWAGADGPTGDFLVEEGGKVGLMYGYETDGNGMYAIDDFTYNNGTYTLKEGIADNSALIGARWFGPGSLKFVNQNPEEGPGVDAQNDKVVIGNANPIHTGGFNLTAEYKGIDFSAFLNWVYGNDIYNANKLNFTNYWGGRLYKNILAMMDSKSRFIRIDPETGAFVSDPARLAELNKDAKYWSASMQRAPLHSWVIEDGSFLRLNNVTIGYSLPKKVLSRLGLQQLRLYVTGYNLWLWTNYSGYDPEVDAIRSTPLTPGIDYNAYPRCRSFNIGMNLTF
ncbi:MAG: SusC/RagA family TonB-linked outer membrane protein [Mangrovibacterium sp.]